VSGHSAGGHLAAVMAQKDPDPERSIDQVIRASIPISGLYDLNAILETPHNKQIRMLPESAEAATATRNVESIACKITMAVGGQETRGFLWQHSAFKDRCVMSGKTITDLICAGANHFSIIDDLSRADSALFRTVWSEMNG